MATKEDLSLAQVTALTSLFDQQVIDREEFRDILVQGEVLPSANEAKPE